MGTFGGWMKARRDAAEPVALGELPEAEAWPLREARPHPGGRRAPEPAFAEDPASRLRRLEALRHDELYVEQQPAP
ncbi:hypothetical protein NBH00_00195 [Paraconexibacter antarcticus]|uniref:Uncharacterized protein n=1 Tax=Paraconexibacter antarcticus TaxID=2949664 RepID=A0ABY5DT49_9ACTN|nr:hypothetical protein [Paraconexibacter antarcticus]UTI64645.1 hypothetical protein NBH00_00195 [Paraconexibacter antarcticus]